MTQTTPFYNLWTVNEVDPILTTSELVRGSTVDYGQ